MTKTGYILPLSSEQYSAIHYSVLYSKVPFTAQYCRVQCTPLCGAAQYSALQCSVLHSAVHFTDKYCSTLCTSLLSTAQWGRLHCKCCISLVFTKLFPKIVDFLSIAVWHLNTAPDILTNKTSNLETKLKHEYSNFWNSTKYFFLLILLIFWGYQ